MPGITIVGAQWGDEGKGKLVDALAEKTDIVARFGGGNNAGHTLVVNGVKTKLNLVPSGILRPNTKCYVGAGVVLNASVFSCELKTLKENGIVIQDRLFVDERATLVLPFHIAIDKAREENKGENKIGTTGRGIGPSYEDRAARTAVLMGDLKNLDKLKPRLETRVQEANLYLKHILNSSVSVSFEEVWSEVIVAANTLLPMLADVSYEITKATKEKKRIIFEGAQATMLDVTHGTVPFVTSSHCIGGSVLTGLGIGSNCIDHVLVVAKAYCTRVGAGPFPTELQDSIGDSLREIGQEFGTVTGRPRRCGWFDAVAMKRAIQLNGATSVALTKLDILSGLNEIKVCTSYKYKSEIINKVPSCIDEFSLCESVYVTFPGWKEDLSNCKSMEELPVNARSYVATLEKILECPISVVSVGPERTALLDTGDHLSFFK